MICHEAIREGTFPCREVSSTMLCLLPLLPWLGKAGDVPAASLLCPRCCYFPPFIPGTCFSPITLTEPVKLSALVSTLTCSPGARGFFQSCSGEGSAGDMAHTSACAPGCGEHPGPVLPLYVPRQGSQRSTGWVSGLQGILRLVPAKAMDLALLPVSMLHAEPWSPPHPCSKVLPRNSLCKPGCARCRGAVGDRRQTGRSCG